MEENHSNSEEDVQSSVGMFKLKAVYCLSYLVTELRASKNNLRNEIYQLTTREFS